MTGLRSPIRWFGGKGPMVAKLLPLFPSHHTYVEPFGGGASMLCAKEPSHVEVYNDLDEGLVGFFRVLRDPLQFKKFCRMATTTPYSRAEYNRCRAEWAQMTNPVERAWAWYVVARQSFSGDHGASWSSVVTLSRRGMVQTASQWLCAIESLPALHKRFQRVQIEQADFRVILDRYDTPKTLFYCDPPYVHRTRSETRYRIEMPDGDHREFVELVLSRRGMVIVSGYANEIYEPLEAAGWERRDFETACHAAGKTRASNLQGKGTAMAKQARTETVWRSPNCLAAGGQGRLGFGSR